ncbi:membrane protein [Mycolicibacterium chubuense]|nr:membrane protein [Mycolicibacterium chubuense]
MTAITTRHAPPVTPSEAQLLRLALRADATLCAGLGLFVAMAADPLARLSGLTATANWIAGAALVAYGVLVYSAARVPSIRGVGLAVLAGNIAFVATVAVMLAAGWLPLTRWGEAAAVGFTVVTVVLAALQYLGVRRLA